MEGRRTSSEMLLVVKRPQENVSFITKMNSKLLYIFHHPSLDDNLKIQLIIILVKYGIINSVT